MSSQCCKEQDVSCVCACVDERKSSPHLTRSLQISKVDIGNEEDRLGLQVCHGFEQRVISPLNGEAWSRAATFPCSGESVNSASVARQPLQVQI